MKVFVIGGVTCADDAPDRAASAQKMAAACRSLGAEIAASRNTLVVCSPFDDSADSEVLRGFTSHPQHRDIPVEFHIPDSKGVRSRLESLQKELDLQNLTAIPYPPPVVDTREGRIYAWLVCQLSALDAAHVTFAIGGRLDGSANMLLLVAEGRGKTLLPFPFLGGAAQRAFERRRYVLQDKLGADIDSLNRPACTSQAIRLTERLLGAGRQRAARRQSPQFFISYPRARPCEADHAETILRRRGLQVFRDEHDFGAGHELPAEIQAALSAADVFIAIWCAEYACSPHCYDEMETALDRREANQLEIWIFCVDGTRMVPKRARNVIYYTTRSREEFEGKLLDLIERGSER